MDAMIRNFVNDEFYNGCDNVCDDGCDDGIGDGVM